MSTFKELSDISQAARTAAEIYVAAKEDGKFDFDDLKENFDKLLTLANEVKEAVTIDEPISFGELDPDQIKSLVEYNLNTAFLILEVPAEGPQTPTYSEIKEIVVALQSGADLFYSMAEDGKISFWDIPSNLSGVLDFTAAAKLAVTIEGAINLSEITRPQAEELLALFFEAIMTVWRAIEKLQTESDD